MMIKLKSLFFSFFLSLGVIRPIKLYSSLKSLSFSSLYTTGEENQFDYSITCKNRYSLKLTILIANELYPDGKIIYENTFTSSEVGSFIYDNSFTKSKNNEIIVKQLCNGATKTSRQAVDTALTSTKRIDEPFFAYNSNSNLYKFTTSGGWSTSKEIINFVNFDEYYIPDYYHKLDPRDFKLSISNEISDNFNFRSGTLTINNYQNAFKLISRKAEISFPLKLVKDATGEYHLDFKNLLYVNKTTLEMSLGSKTNSAATHCLYFPLNQKQNEAEFNIKILLEGVGVDYSDFFLDFKYKSISNIFGDCHNSEYCIVNS